jgi:four helix bundle protein
MTPEDLKERTTAFAVEAVKFCCHLRLKPEARHIADQLNDSSTSTAANYRAACRARSHREFVSKIAVAVEEADESVGWLEVITRAGLASGEQPDGLLREGREILAILAASRKTAEGNGPPRR